MSAGRAWGDLITPSSIPVNVPTRQKTASRHEGLAYQRMYAWADYPEEPPAQKYREDPNDPESPVLERDAPWWTPRSIGFRAKILVNPLGGEVRVETQKYVAYITGTGIEEDHLTAIADRVVEWEYVIIGEDGVRREVEPPAVGGWERFMDLPNDVLVWLREEVRTAHLPKKTRSSKSAGNTDSTIQTEIDPALDAPES